MRKILLIEDNEGDRVLFKKTAQEKLEIIHVKTLAEGLAVKAEDFDVIVSDLSLPDGYALEIIDAIKQHFPSKPVIILSGLALESDEEDINTNMKHKGVFAFVHKNNFKKVHEKLKEAS